jgi:hypothetical protein
MSRWWKFAYAKPNVQSIIDFYHTALDKHEKYYTGKHLALTAAEQQGRFENSEKTFYQVIEELEQGHWEPGGEFPGMNHPYFWRHNQRFNNLDKIISGSIADKKPIGKSIRKRWKLT